MPLPASTLASGTSPPPWTIAADGSCCAVAVPAAADGGGAAVQNVDLSDLSVGSCPVPAPCAAVALSPNALLWALVSRQGARHPGSCRSHHFRHGAQRRSTARIVPSVCRRTGVVRDVSTVTPARCSSLQLPSWNTLR